GTCGRVGWAGGKFSQQAPLAALQSAVLVYRLGELPLPAEKGGPVRFLIPNLEECNVGGVDRCANVKALARLRIERSGISRSSSSTPRHPPCSNPRGTSARSTLPSTACSRSSRT